MTLKSTLLFLSILLISPFLSNAQSTPQCGFDELHQRKLQDDLEYRKATENFNKAIYEQTKNGVADRGTNGTIHVIPVVVHVMHLPGEAIGTGSNISDAQVQAGIDHLNAAYRNSGDYAGGPYHSNAGIASADPEIQFCLAVRDPNGNATSGINRVATNYSNLYRDDNCGAGTQDNCLKALSFWDSHDYMNVWLVNEICLTSNPDDGCGVAGYAYFPSSHGEAHDGVVNEAAYWGTSTNNSKVHIHEVGHYLGLYHTFQGGCSETDCQTGGDFVCDTPPDNSTAAVSCNNNTTANTCSNDASIANSPFNSDVQDIYEDYMDYGYQSCQNTFTPGQVVRMRAALTTTRASLLTSSGCTPAAVPVSDFTSNLTTGCAGISVTFSDNSANGSTAWNWSFPGGSPSSSTDQNPTIVYNSAGSFNVSLTASNNIGTGNTETKTNYITTLATPNNQCTPTGTIGLGGIANFSFGSISNNTGNATTDGAVYLDFSCSDIAELNVSRSYELSCAVGNSTNPPDNYERVKVYIDYNNDGDFDDAGEMVGETPAGYLYLGTIPAITINTPASPTLGSILRMRVIADHASIGSACHTLTTGQAEDYGVFFPAPLPVELNSFSARKSENNTLLTWQTESEINNQFFTLEHSTDGVSFQHLARIKSKGNGSVANNYSYLHRTPTEGVNHYRLSQTDLDGTQRDLGVRTVLFKTKKVLVSVHPNPVQTDMINIQYVSPSNTDIDIEIVDITGRVLHQEKITATEGANLFELPVNGLSNGIYFIRTQQINGIKITRFVLAR